MIDLEIIHRKNKYLTIMLAKVDREDGSRTI